MIRRFLSLIALAGLIASPVLAQQKPLVSMGGQTRQLPAGTTLGVSASTTGAASLNIPAGVAPTSPANGDCWTTTAGLICRINGVNVTSFARAATNAALTALPSTLGTVLRTGYTVDGDVPALPYVASGSACSLNAGAGNGGSQIPTSDSKCWIASLDPLNIPVVQFGAKCDGTTNDAAAINAALTYAGARGSGVVTLPGATACKVSSTLTVPTGVTLKGTGSNSASQLNAGVINLNPLIDMTGTNSAVTDLMIYQAAAGTNASGLSIRINSTSSEFNRIENVRIFEPCNGIEIRGGSFHRIAQVYLNQVRSTGCAGIRVGTATTGGANVGIQFDHVTVAGYTSDRPDYCYAFYDAGGIFVQNSESLFCNIGTIIAPQANQQFIWAFFNNTTLGDTTNSTAFLIDPGAASAKVQGLNCVGCWASNSQTGNNIVIQNSGGGTIDGIHFVGSRVMTGFGNAMVFNAGTNITVDSSRLCAYGQTGIFVAGSITKVQVTNTTIRAACDGVSQASLWGMILTGANSDMILSNLDIQGNATGQVSGVPAGNATVSDIIPYSTTRVSIASAATVDPNTLSSNYAFTGTTTINTMNSYWNGRVINITTPSGAINFTGGNMCNTLSSGGANATIIATYTGSCWNLK